MASIPTVPAKVWAESIELSTWIDGVLIDEEDDATYVLPEDASYAILTSPNPFWISLDSESSGWISEDVTDGGGSLYVPSGIQLRVPGGATLYLVSAEGVTGSTPVSIAVYSSL